MNKEHLHPDGRPYTKEEFVEKIKTDKEFAKKFGNLGKIYGSQWRNWNGNIDQISDLIKQLKENPDSRRLLVSAWNISDLPNQVLPPCHYGFQVYTRELSREERYKLVRVNGLCPKYSFEIEDGKPVPNKLNESEWYDKYNVPKRAISLMWNQRSVDTFLGLPFNIASYGLLLEIIAKTVNMVPDQLIGNLGDTHLYSNHIEQAKEQIGRELSLEERHQLALPIWKEKYGPLVNMMVMTNVDNTPYEIPKRTREPFPLPKLHINDEFWNPDADLLSNLPNIQLSDFYVDNYQSHPTIKAPLSN
jgi:thymidylate synthase